MKMLMTGVGNVPTTPSPFIPTMIPGSCESMELQWGKSNGRGFDVHKYRVFRRVVETEMHAASKVHGKWQMSMVGRQLLLPAGGRAGATQEPGSHSYGHNSRGALQRAESWTLIYDGIEEVRKRRRKTNAA